jgi:uncharacterized membrane protein YgcG
METLSLYVSVLIFLFPVASISGKYPQFAHKYVNDFAQVLNAPDITDISQKLKTVDVQTGAEISVATINSIRDFQDTPHNFEQFATGLFNTWGIGKSSANNGVLLLVAVKDRKVRIELGSGYPSYYNNIAQKIIDDVILPRFKEGKYNSGIYDGTQAIIGAVTKQVSWLEYHKWSLVIVILLAVLIVGVSISYFRAGKNGWGWMVLLGGVALLAFLWRLLSGPRDKSGGSSFGGGSSSGGGASGGW